MFDGKTFLDQFDSACNEIHLEIERQRPRDMLYKYMTYEGLENILATKRLRYTDYRFFNDPSEILFGKGVIKEALLAADIPSVHKENFLKVISKIFDNFDNLYQIYVGCFSTSINRLALWRYYACNGTGFAIGFNEKFQKIDPHVDFSLGKAVICKVVYGEEQAAAVVNQFIDQYRQVLASANHNAKTESREAYIDFLKQIDSRLAAHLITFLPIFKDKSFSDEDEIRMFYTEGEAMLDQFSGKPFNFDDSLRDFVEIDKSSHPFVNNLTGKKPVILPEEFSIDAISEIWIGPCCEFGEAKIAIKNLLMNNGYNLNKIQIKQMNLPYSII